MLFQHISEKVGWKRIKRKIQFVGKNTKNSTTNLCYCKGSDECLQLDCTHYNVHTRNDNCGTPCNFNDKSRFQCEPYYMKVKE